jgi:hypothetical protein
MKNFTIARCSTLIPTFEGCIALMVWTEQTTSNSGVISNKVFDLQVYDGSFYFGTDSCISIKEGSSRTHITPANSNIPARIRHLTISGDLDIAISSEHLCYKLHSANVWTILP